MNQARLVRDATAGWADEPSDDVDDDVHVLSLVDGLATAEVGSCCVLFWRRSVTRARYQLQKEALLHVTSRFPGTSSILCVIEDASEPVNQELREEASQLLTELGPKIRCLAFVVEGSGFRAAMIRGVLSSIELLKRYKLYPTRYFGHVAHAATWIHTQTGEPAQRLIGATNYLRRRLDSLYGSRQSVRASGERPSYRY